MKFLGILYPIAAARMYHKDTGLGHTTKTDSNGNHTPFHHPRLKTTEF